MANGSSSESGEQRRLVRKLNWYKWVLVSVVSLFIAGFATREYLAAFASTRDVHAAVEGYSTGHANLHRIIDDKLKNVDERTISLIKQSEAIAERQKLNTYLIELRVSPPRARPKPTTIDDQRVRVEQAERAAGL